MNTITDLVAKKKSKEKITMITCYDYTSATIINDTNIDCVLVGDSAAMVMHGQKDTTNISIEKMAWLTESVARGLKNKLLIGDMPFMSYRKDRNYTVDAATKLIQAGAQAIKLEGAKGNLESITHLVESGIPVMGHIGLTPQLIHTLGGFKVQGKNADSRAEIIEQAKQLTNAGCFSLVIECTLPDIAKEITESIDIPTIGIGAGCDTDGQVLVWQDLLGLQTDFKPKFVKHYLNGKELITASINNYVAEVHDLTFPGSEHTYKV